MRTLNEKGAEGECLRHAPVDALAALDHGLALIIHTFDLAVRLKVLGDGRDGHANILQHLHGHAYDQGKHKKSAQSGSKRWELTVIEALMNSQQALQ